MVTIRLSRQGKKNDPFYRIVATEKQRKLSGEALDVLGYYHPRENVKQIDHKKIEEWVKKGAQITPAVQKLMEETKKTK